jgi:imidazolonepropionase-like amidohydrolase
MDHLRYFIESGITSIRDVASKGEVPFLLKTWASGNRIPGPRVFAAGQLITGLGGHGDGEEGIHRDPAEGAIYIASGPDGWREAVRIQFKRGADVIKIASHFSRAEVSAAVQEAHALGLKVTCDCETFYIQWAVEAGVDMIEHPLPRTDETIRLMKQKGVASDPTLETYIIIFNRFGNYYDSTSRRFTFSEADNLKLAQRLRKAGIPMGVGTDLIEDWYKTMPSAYIAELKQFVKFGYTVPQALVAATKTSADLLDMGDKLGTLEPGKLADVTIVAGQPDVNLDDLANVDTVIRDGYVEVEQGRLFIPRHVPIPLPVPKPPQPTPGP